MFSRMSLEYLQADFLMSSCHFDKIVNIYVQGNNISSTIELDSFTCSFGISSAVHTTFIIAYLVRRQKISCPSALEL